ncbi:MAG: phosphoesterase [Acidobacteria bacterium]|nr:phosphoesterase [Acidobacteriota bacterium]
MKFRILHHDHCFDGFASAAVFARFLKEQLLPDAEIGFRGLSHQPNQKVIEAENFDGDQNAIVDFKYSPSERLTWWFDHHQSAFLSPEDERHYFDHPWPTKFYNPEYKSCTKFIADTLSEKYGFDQSRLSELIKWADIIDGAQYETPKVAVELQEPALKLMMVIEASHNDALMLKIIQAMQDQPLADIVADADFQNEFQPLLARHQQMLDLIRQAAHSERGVVYFDLSQHNAVGYSKFIPYYLFPECVYSVSLSLTPTRSKVSVGYNPWSGKPRRHNLASICERYNGGGHAVVGAISYRTDELERARQTAEAIAEELRS